MAKNAFLDHDISSNINNYFFFLILRHCLSISTQILFNGEKAKIVAEKIKKITTAVELVNALFILIHRHGFRHEHEQ